MTLLVSHIAPRGLATAICAPLSSRELIPGRQPLCGEDGLFLYELCECRRVMRKVL